MVSLKTGQKKSRGALMSAFRLALILVMIAGMIVVLPGSASRDAGAVVTGPTDAVSITLIDPPTSIAAGDSVSFEMQVQGGPAINDGEYNFTAILDGKNTTGGTVTDGGSSQDGKFDIEITAPTATGRIYLEINATSTKDNVTEFNIMRFRFSIRSAINIKATLNNTGVATIQDAEVSIYLDGKYVGRRTTGPITGNSSTDIILLVPDTGLSSGRHTVTLKLENASMLVRFWQDSGTSSTELTTSFYKEPESINHSGFVFIGVMVVLIVIMVSWILFKRSYRKKKK